MSLDDTKISQQSNIPAKIIEMNVDMFCIILHSEINKAIKLSKFSSCMKMADVTPVYEKESQLVNYNYCPISTLPNLSKVSERCLY